MDLDMALKFHPLEEPRGLIKENGFAIHSLCKQCNEKTGRWYVSQYVEWAQEAHRILAECNGDPRVARLYYGYPARFLKQVVTMLLSAGGPNLADNYPEFRQFVEYKKAKLYGPRAKIYAYYNPGLRIRLREYASIIDSNTGKISVFTEFAHYPFGFVFLDEGTVLDSRLYEITKFGSYEYDEFARVPMPLAALPVVDPIGAQYFSMELFRQMRIPEDAERWKPEKRSGPPPKIEKFAFGERMKIDWKVNTYGDENL